VGSGNSDRVLRKFGPGPRPDLNPLSSPQVHVRRADDGGALDPACARQRIDPYRRRPVRTSSNGNASSSCRASARCTRHRLPVPQGHARRPREAKRRVAVYLQELVQELDLMDPRAWAPMCQLRQIRERGGAEIDQVLTLQIAPRALARCRGDTLCPVLRFGAVLPFPAFENRAESLMSAGFSGTNPTLSATQNPQGIDAKRRHRSGTASRTSYLHPDHSPMIRLTTFVRPSCQELSTACARQLPVSRRNMRISARGRPMRGAIRCSREQCCNTHRNVTHPSA
jgi:hypothetical protein